MKSKPEFHEVRFEVRGSGRFPLDMLRYDTACPATGEDASRIAQDTRGERAVTLRRFTRDPNLFHGGVSIDRWASFGWKLVVSC